MTIQEIQYKKVGTKSKSKKEIGSPIKAHKSNYSSANTNRPAKKIQNPSEYDTQGSTNPAKSQIFLRDGSQLSSQPGFTAVGKQIRQNANTSKAFVPKTKKKVSMEQ